jgi:hypothetical protein
MLPYDPLITTLEGGTAVIVEAYGAATNSMDSGPNLGQGR